MIKILLISSMILTIVMILIAGFDTFCICYATECRAKVREAIYEYNEAKIYEGKFDDTISYMMIDFREPSLMHPRKYWKLKDYVPDYVWEKIKDYIPKKG